jgi:hypothetical protein
LNGCAASDRYARLGYSDVGVSAYGLFNCLRKGECALAIRDRDGHTQNEYYLHDSKGRREWTPL